MAPSLTLLAKPWDQHAHPLAVLGVIGTQGLQEIAFFVANAHENINRHPDRKEQVPLAHVGRGPKGQQEPAIDRVPHEHIEAGLPKPCLGDGGAPHVGPDLPKPEEFEVIEEEGGDQDHHQPRAPSA